jgi:hypothetical protein
MDSGLVINQYLSEADREILKALLNPDGRYSSVSLSNKLGIPIQRRRKRLEKEFLELSYSLDIEKFGWHRVDLLIATMNGKASSVAKQLLSNDEVTYVGKSIGEHTIDLRAEIIIRDNAQLTYLRRLRLWMVLKTQFGVKLFRW